MCMPRKRAYILGYACAPRFHTEFWKQWQPRLPFFKIRAHAYQFCIPIPHMPPARLPKTGRMPTNFASRCRAYRPHGFQKQGACLPILHPDSAHAARTVFKSRAPIQPEHTWNSPRRYQSKAAVSRRMVFECKATVGPRMEVVCPQTLTRLNTFSTATRIY